MEKTYLQASSQEIVVNGGAPDGRVDVFSYGPGSDEAMKQLGHLFIIGHAIHERDDVGYAVNLVAALAKREYYTDSASTPKAAFTRMLKKINEVVDDFFKNKGLTMNIGIFAIAGENIVISKLGKFKILLARAGKTIDILNNIEHFEKELVEKREFSNIISGRVSSHDKVLAYYPSAPLTSRERYLKSYLLSMEPEAFTEKINSIGAGNTKFSGALLYVNLKQIHERVQTPKVEPAEILQAQLAAKPEPVVPAHKPQEPATSKIPAEESPDNETLVGEEAGTGTPAKEERPAGSPATTEPQEPPRIIPTEFFLGKRATFVTTLTKKMRFLNLMTPKGRAIVALAAVILVISVSLVVKSLFFISPAERKLRQTISEAQTNLKLAQTKITQSDVLGARMLLASTLSSIQGLGDKASEATSQQTVKAVYGILDAIDHAKDISPSVVYQLPGDVGIAKLISRASDGTLVVYTFDDKAQIGYLLRVQGETLRDKTEIKDFTPTALYAGTDAVILADSENSQVAVAKDGKVQKLSLEIQNPVDASFYEGNLYMLTAEGIYKVTDIVQGKAKASPWLAKDVAPAAGPLFITVDGNINIMTTSGTITVYYKGKKIGEASTSLIPAASDVFTTESESPSLMLVQKQSGRIYIIDKKTLSLVQTLKVGTADPILSAVAGLENSVYFVTKDNKIWKAQ